MNKKLKFSTYEQNIQITANNKNNDKRVKRILGTRLGQKSMI